MSIKWFNIHEDDHCGFYLRVCEDGRLVYYDDPAAATPEADGGGVDYDQRNRRTMGM